jgi:DinB family protein
MDEAQGYNDRLLAYTTGTDPLTLQAEMPDLLAACLAGQTAARLRQRPLPDKWSVVEIVAHLAEDEISASWRYRQMLEHDGVALGPFDQETWATLGSYESWDPADALAMFRLLRAANLRLLRSLNAEQRQRHGVHAERGRMTVDDLARHMAGHDRNHLEQIQRQLKPAASA